MDSRNSQNGITLTGRIDRKTHNVEDLKSKHDSWDEMSKSEKLEASRSVEPVDTDTTYNVTTDRFHEYFVDNLDADNTNPEANVAATWLALGSDDTAPVTSNTELNNRVFEGTVTDHGDNGKELLVSTLIGSNEANGVTLNELGLWTGDPANSANDDVFLINHATFSPVTKDNTKTVTFEVTLTFSDI